MKIAFITGITGQDGQYLSELLIEKGYEVHGLVRYSSSEFDTERMHQDVKIHLGDMTDSLRLFSILKEVQPTEIYNLAAMTHVGVSFNTPKYTSEVNSMGVINILESIRVLGLNTRIYQASTSELFGKVMQVPQSETTPFYPRSPYGVSKLHAYWNIVNYREAYGIFACNGILFNHESPIRGENFVTRKITKAIAKMSLDQSCVLKLGNLNAERDWGHAKDYVYAMWLMLQQPEPEDFVIASGKSHSVRHFLETAFSVVGVKLSFLIDDGVEVGIVNSSTNDAFVIGRKVVETDGQFIRPSEVETLLGDPSKAIKILGWEPEYTFEELVNEMMEKDLNEIRK